MNQIEKEKLRKRVAFLVAAFLLQAEAAFALTYVLTPSEASPSRLLMALLAIPPFLMSVCCFFAFSTE